MSETNIISDSQDKSGKRIEPDYQNVLRAEFTKLHKEYRSLENRRHVIAQRDGYIHKLTDRIMPILETDHTELQHEMRNATCRKHTRNAGYLANNMREALKTFDMYQVEIAKKIKQIAEIERHVDRITDKVIKQRFQLLALHGLSKTMAQRERDLAKAEDRLYHHACAFNLQIHENKKLREEIMDFLMERKRFFKMHNGIKRQIAFAKKSMLNIVQQAIATYDSRDEAMSKVKALREREHKEVKQHGMEVQEFERTLHHDKSILDFIKMKLKTRPAFEDASDRRIRIGSAKERELDAILKKYRRSFRKILAYSNTQSILDLVDKYNAMDSDNFESFKYITDLNNECEVLRETIEFLKSNIEDAHCEVERQEQEQRNSQHELQLSIISRQEQMDVMQNQQIRNHRKHMDVFDAIAAALVLCKCNVAPILMLLGNKDGIDENNIRLCFTQLDIKITEMRCERDRLKEIQSMGNLSVNTFKSVLGKSKPPPSQGGPFLPSVMILHGESVDDEDTKIFEIEPYYYDEMKQYVFEKMVEDKLVDPLRRQLSISPSGNNRKSIAGPPGRKTLVERVQESELEPGNRKRRRRNPFSEVESTASISTTEAQLEVTRRKTESLVKLGHQLQHHLLKKDSTKDRMSHPVSDYIYQEPVLEPPPEDTSQYHQEKRVQLPPESEVMDDEDYAPVEYEE